jgi:hypothetical protein
MEIHQKRWKSVIGHRSSVISHREIHQKRWKSVIGHRSSVIGHRPSVIHIKSMIFDQNRIFRNTGDKLFAKS